MAATTPPVQRRRGAKERILAAADDLFYNEGIHTVGIERVVERAGVAKGSLYYSFESKDDLVRAYLTKRHGMWAERVSAGVDAHSDPRERVLAVFDVLGELFARPDYRGCAFMNATAEAADDSAEVKAAVIFRGWVHELFFDLASATAAPAPGALADSLVVLYDGASATSQMDKNPAAAGIARDLAALLLDRTGVKQSRTD